MSFPALHSSLNSPTLAHLQISRSGRPRSTLTVCSGKGFGPKKEKAPNAAVQKEAKRAVAADIPVQLKSKLPESPPSNIASSSNASTDSSRFERSRVAEVPAVVNDRILNRILLFAGLPVFLGICLYPLFYYLKVVQKVDLPMSVVYLVQLVTFGGGLFGISYGALSASWDASQEGSKLGFNEFKANLPVMLEQLRKK